MSKAFPRGCGIFECGRRRNNACCRDCGYRKFTIRGKVIKCDDACLNDPEKCGEAIKHVDMKKEEEN